MTSAETIEASTPIDSVTPKPRTGPEARKNSSPAASSVVTLESMIADHALLKPASARARRLCAARRRTPPGPARRPARWRRRPCRSRARSRPGRAASAWRRARPARRRRSARTRQRDRREHADQPVDHDDEQAVSGHADHARPRAAPSIAAVAQRRADRALLDHLDRHRQRAAPDRAARGPWPRSA